MDGSIYRLFFYSTTPAESGLTSIQKDELRNRQRALAQSVGMRQLLLADMRWSSEQHQYFGVSLYPSLDALHTYMTGLRQMDMWTYIRAQSYLGIPLDGTANQMSPPTPPCQDDEPVYRVYLSRLTPRGHSLAPDELNEINGLANDEARTEGSQVILSAYTRWNNEEWEYFGIERFPCMDALLRYSQYLSVSNWYSVWQSRSFLGKMVREELIF